MIDARTRLVCLLGHPVAHSLSPALHNAGFREAGHNACYMAFDVPPAALPAAVAGLRALGCLGANVTVPHKERVLDLLDEVDPAARAAGAVNTVAWREGRLVGYNTDGDGFLASLAEVGFDPRGRAALLFGAGGAARGVGLALLRAGVDRLWLVNRTAGRAEALARSLALAVAGLPPVEAVPADGGVVVREARDPVRRQGPGAAVAALPLEADAVRRVAAGAELVVNCTAVGMHPHADEAVWQDFSPFPAGVLVVDLVYNPARTRFLALAAEQGRTVLGGLGMLVHQAAQAWRHWFGAPGPVEVFYRAARAALAGGSAAGGV